MWPLITSCRLSPSLPLAYLNSKMDDHPVTGLDAGGEANVTHNLFFMSVPLKGTISLTYHLFRGHGAEHAGTPDGGESTA